MYMQLGRSIFPQLNQYPVTLVSAMLSHNPLWENLERGFAIGKPSEKPGGVVTLSAAFL